MMSVNFILNRLIINSLAEEGLVSSVNGKMQHQFYWVCTQIPRIAQVEP